MSDTLIMERPLRWRSLLSDPDRRNVLLLGSAVSGNIGSERPTEVLLTVNGVGGGVGEAHLTALLVLLKRLRPINVLCFRLFFSKLPGFGARILSLPH